MTSNVPIKNTLVSRVDSAVREGRIVYSQPVDDLKIWEQTVRDTAEVYGVPVEVAFDKGLGYARANRGFPAEVEPFAPGSNTLEYRLTKAKWDSIVGHLSRGC